MAGMVLCWRCGFWSSSAWLNRNGVLSRAFSTTDPTTQARINKVRVSRSGVGSMTKKAKGSENWELFKSWMKKRGRTYKSEKEMSFRYKLFCRTQEYVEKTNKEKSGGTSGLPCFADRTRKERVLSCSGGHPRR